VVFFPYLFTPKDLNPKGVLPLSLYKKHIMQFLDFAWYLDDDRVKVVLLNNLERYIPHIDGHMITSLICPQVSLNPKYLVLF